jgi:hypothetical protein
MVQRARGHQAEQNQKQDRSNAHADTECTATALHAKAA